MEKTAMVNLRQNDKLKYANASFRSVSIKELFVDEEHLRNPPLKASVWYVAAYALSELCEAMGIEDMKAGDFQKKTEAFEAFLREIREEREAANYWGGRTKISSAMFWYFLSLGLVKLYCKSKESQWFQVDAINDDGKWVLQQEDFDLRSYAKSNPYDVFRLLGHDAEDILKNAAEKRNENTKLTMQNPRLAFVMMEANQNGTQVANQNGTQVFGRPVLSENIRGCNYAFVIRRKNENDPKTICALDASANTS